MVKSNKDPVAILDILNDLEEAEGGSVVGVVSAPSSPATGSSSVLVGPVAQSSIGQLLKQPIESVDDVAKLFKAAKAPAEVFAYAQDCSTAVWLDWMVKLSPKKVDLKGQVDVRAVFANLGPRAKP